MTIRFISWSHFIKAAGALTLREGYQKVYVEFSTQGRQIFRQIFSNIDPLPTLYGEFHKYFFEPFPKAVLSSAHIHNIQPSRHPT